MKIWKNTNTLDCYINELKKTVPHSEATVAIIGSKPIDLNIMPNLKVIFKCGVGTDNIPFEEAEKRGIKIILPSAKTKNFIYEETANFTTFLILNELYKKTGDLSSWTKEKRVFLSEKKVLVIGQGNIGKLVKEKLQKLVTVKSFDVLENKDEELEILVRESDVVTLHIPLTDSTHNFIDEEKISWMKKNSSLVNTSRGPIVSEDALFDAINNNKITASFDVFWEEPYHGKLTQFYPERFMMTPHVSSNCVNFLDNLAQDFINQLLK